MFLSFGFVVTCMILVLGTLLVGFGLRFSEFGVSGGGLWF